MVSKWDVKSIALLGLYCWSQRAAIAITPAVLAGSKGVLDLMWTSGNVSRHRSFWLFWILSQLLHLFLFLPLNCHGYFLVHGLVTLRSCGCSSLLQAIIPTVLLPSFLQNNLYSFAFFSQKTLLCIVEPPSALSWPACSTDSASKVLDKVSISIFFDSVS